MHSWSFQTLSTGGKYKILSIMTIVIVIATIYRPILDAGFWSDEYQHIAPATRLPLKDFLAYYLDPTTQSIWYRPIQGILLGAEYGLFKNDPRGYHLVHLILHIANTVLLFALVTRITRNWRIGFISALGYSTWAIYSLAVFWVGVADPIVGVFCITALGLWYVHLERADRYLGILAHIALIGALLTKETAVVIPFVFVLTDRWLVAKPATRNQLFTRYLPSAIIVLIYGIVDYMAVAHGAFTRDTRYGVGFHLLSNTLQYLSLWSFPWGLPTPLGYIWLFLILCIFLYFVVRRNARILFLGVIGPLLITPVLPFPLFDTRYLYLPLMVSAVGFALFIEGIYPKIAFAYCALPALILAASAITGASTTSDDAQGFAALSRQLSLQFRPIFQRHPSLNPRTLFYFVDQPYDLANLDGAMALRYGPNVIVDGVEGKNRVGFRNYPQAFAFYADDGGILREVKVDREVDVHGLPNPPIQFKEGISLEGFELSTNRIKKGEAIVLILYWKTAERIDRDYTVFVHLIDRDGNVVAGSDGQPKRGMLPTSKWRVSEFIMDPSILVVDEDAPIGNNFRLELGLYYAPTMARLALASEGDTRVIIEPISILP